MREVGPGMQERSLVRENRRGMAADWGRGGSVGLPQSKGSLEQNPEAPGDCQMTPEGERKYLCVLGGMRVLGEFWSW